MKLKKEKAAKQKGRVVQFNYSPKGVYEGFLLKTAQGNIQVNFPPDFAEEVTLLVSVGDQITAVAVLEEPRDGADHPVYQLGALHVSGGRKLDLSSEKAKSSHAFEGVAKTLNYAKHGEPNGAILDSGDFVHLRPHGAREVQLEVGQNLKGKGSSRPLAGGGVVVEAETVNGIALKVKAKAKKKHGPKHAH